MIVSCGTDYFLRFQAPRYRYADSSTLVVEGVGVSDRGLFRCTATNEAGSTSANARVEILGMSIMYL